MFIPASRLWLSRVIHRTHQRAVPSRPARFRPSLEVLERRLCPSLTLNQAGRDAGIVLSTFAVDFPSSSNNGPNGIAFPSSGGVLVTDYPGNVRRFPTDADGQSASGVPPARSYGLGRAVGLAQVGDAFGGAIYMTAQQSLGNPQGVYQLNPNGTVNHFVVVVPHATGIVANPANGHLFVSSYDGNQIREVDPAAIPPTSTVFWQGQPAGRFDGLTISADGSILYAARTSDAVIAGFDTSTGQNVFTSDQISGGPDGVAIGVGPLVGKLFVNTNGGTVVEVDIATGHLTTIATGGSRGDFVTIDPSDGSALFTQTDRIIRFTFPFGAAQRIAAGGFPFQPTAGTPGSLTVTALDRDGLPATGYTGTVHLASSDGQAVLPADYTFTAADRGSHTFTNLITLKTAGSQSITVTDTTDPRLLSTQSGILVTPAATSAFAVAFPPTTRAGEPRAFTVVALDPYGNTTPSYTGTVHLTGSDAQAVFEDDHTFTHADGGVYPFGVELRTAGTQSLTATDTATASLTDSQSGIVVTPAAAAHFQLSVPTGVGSGTPFDLTVVALDAYGNVDVNYTGTVTFSTSDPDPGVVLPPDYTFSAADAGMVTRSGAVTLFTPGGDTLTATDRDSGITGSVLVDF